MTKETNKLIEELSKNIESVKIFSPFKLFLIWGISLIAVALFMVFVVRREDLWLKLQSGSFFSEIMFAFATGLFGALAASWLATPDVKQQKWVIWLPFLSLTFLMMLVAYQVVIQPVNITESDFGIGCAVDIFIFIMIPAVILLFILRKAASTHNILSSVVAVISVASFGYLCSRLICPNDILEHLILWHYLPILLVAIIAAFIGAKVLKW